MWRVVRYLGMVIGGAALLLLFLNSLFAGPYLPPSDLPERGLTDIHIHVAGLGLPGSDAFVSDEFRQNIRFGVYRRAFGFGDTSEIDATELIGDIARQVEESQFVARGVILALDGVMTAEGQLDLQRTQVYVDNDLVATATAGYPHLDFGASIHPGRMDALARLERAASQGARLVKWIPSIQNIDPSNKSYIPFYERMVALGLPLLCHAGQEKAFLHADDALADPLRLTLPLDEGVKVIVAHFATTGHYGGVPSIERLLPLFDKYPNLYADISSLTQVNKARFIPQILSQSSVAARMLDGTDYPLIRTPLVSPWWLPFQLSWQAMWRINQIHNIWDRDVALKQALGFPLAAMADVESVLRPR